MADCCVCLETKPAYVACSHCTKTSVCEECAAELTRTHNYQRCPVCRQLDWYDEEGVSLAPSITETVAPYEPVTPTHVTIYMERDGWITLSVPWSERFCVLLANAIVLAFIIFAIWTS